MGPQYTFPDVAKKGDDSNTLTAEFESLREKLADELGLGMAMILEDGEGEDSF